MKILFFVFLFAKKKRANWRECVIFLLSSSCVITNVAVIVVCYLLLSCSNLWFFFLLLLLLCFSSQEKSEKIQFFFLCVVLWRKTNVQKYNRKYTETGFNYKIQHFSFIYQPVLLFRSVIFLYKSFLCFIYTHSSMTKKVSLYKFIWSMIPFYVIKIAKMCLNGWWCERITTANNREKKR